ncbi:hypothetical protein [Streptomyces sp. NPDC018833]|uniref:hypothetical protein n=1 Tax=Streptomyces sp. NPDC018833 TaxID=3365053 RepID=UPI0037B1A359
MLNTHPYGSQKRVACKTDLIVRVSNQETGDSYDADVSGTAVVDRTDGSRFRWVLGPGLVRGRERAPAISTGACTSSTASAPWTSARPATGQ